jgi:signal peptidase I
VTGPTPGERTAGRGWVGVASAGWLIVVLSLAAWSLAPMAFGWRSVVVETGSMVPALRPGDIAVIDPHRAPQAGQIVVLRDSDVSGGLLTHRVVRVDGTVLTTKGDANAEADPRRSSLADVEGVVRLVVPAAGWVPMLLRHPAPGELFCAALTVAALIGVRFVPSAPTRRRPRHLVG